LAKPEKTVSIWVNENSHQVEKEKISYEEIVQLYLGAGEPPSAEYIIKYSKGHSSNVSGTLTPQKDVMVQDGMRFRVSGTGES
jgi:hypothetical protein